jgi:hypothetical protein
MNRKTDLDNHSRNLNPKDVPYYGSRNIAVPDDIHDGDATALPSAPPKPAVSLGEKSKPNT